MIICLSRVGTLCMLSLDALHCLVCLSSSCPVSYLELKKKLNIAHELSVLKEKLALLDAPLVFCHNDLLLGNIIYDATKGTENDCHCVSFFCLA